MLMYFFAGFFFILTLCMTKLRVLLLCFSYFTDNSNILHTSKDCFFLGEFLLLGNKDKSSRTHRKDFCETKNVPKSERKKILKLSYLTQEVPVSHQNIA